MEEKNVTLKGEVDGEICKLFPKTKAENVFVDDATLAEKLSRMNEAIINAGAVKPFPVREVRENTDIVYIEDLEHDTFYYQPKRLANLLSSADISCGIQGISVNNKGIIDGDIYYFHITQSDADNRYLNLLGQNTRVYANVVDGVLQHFGSESNTRYIGTNYFADYSPVHKFNPTNKKYVDDAIAKAVGNIEIPEVPQADWNQNDPTAPDFVKNRTHWVEAGGTVPFLPTTDLVLNEDLGGYVIFDPLELTSGGQYVVKFSDGVNSVEYTTMCTDMPENSDGVKWVLGDFGLLSGEPVTGEPFVILVFDPAFVPDVGFGAAALTTGAFTTISIDSIGEVVHKIDPKFLPTVSFNVNVWWNGSDYVSDKTYAEIKEAESKRYPIVGTFTNKYDKVYTMIGCDASAANLVRLASFDVGSIDLKVYSIYIMEDGYVGVNPYSYTGTNVDE